MCVRIQLNMIFIMYTHLTCSVNAPVTFFVCLQTNKENLMHLHHDMHLPLLCICDLLVSRTLCWPVPLFWIWWSWQNCVRESRSARRTIRFSRVFTAFCRCSASSAKLRSCRRGRRWSTPSSDSARASRTSWGQTRACVWVFSQCLRVHCLMHFFVNLQSVSRPAAAESHAAGAQDEEELHAFRGKPHPSSRPHERKDRALQRLSVWKMHWY